MSAVFRLFPGFSVLAAMIGNCSVVDFLRTQAKWSGPSTHDGVRGRGCCRCMPSSRLALGRSYLLDRKLISWGTKVKRRISPTALTLLLLTGCAGGGDVGDDVAPPSVPSAGETTTAEPEPTTAEPTSEQPISEQTAEEPATEEPTTEPPGPAKSERGNVVKAIGEAAGIIGEDGQPLVTFVVNSITPDVVCTQEYTEPAENGNFLAVDVSVQTSPAMTDPDALITSFDMSSYHFRTIAPNGTSSNADPDTFAAFSCLDDSVLLPSSIGPGENVTGVVVLDVETPQGILIYENSSIGDGWEWNYPD